MAHLLNFTVIDEGLIHTVTARSEYRIDDVDAVLIAIRHMMDLYERGYVHVYQVEADLPEFAISEEITPDCQPICYATGVIPVFLADRYRDADEGYQGRLDQIEAASQKLRTWGITTIWYQHVWI